ncbi:hypothetical protein PInf_010548 [Phytophthora infestans]|nr:hypothetical protein PInf_010548 [Phytophthora infestans]
MARTKESSKDVVVRRLPRPPRQQGQAEEDNVLRAQGTSTPSSEITGRQRGLLGAAGSRRPRLALIADDDSLPATLTEPDTTIKRPAPRNKAQSKRPAKKRRTTANSLKYSLELPDDVPAAIRRDVDRLIKEAAGRGKTIRLGIRGPGSEPAPRYFFICALYAPTGNSDARRKKKSRRRAGPFAIHRANIEVFGYYSFLAQLEDKAHDNLMWYGGKAAAHSVAAKTQAAQKNRALYDRTIARALDPFSIDEDGYSSVPELLEQTQALTSLGSPTSASRTVALGRIAMDVASRSPPTLLGLVTRLAASGSGSSRIGDDDSDFEGEDDDSYSALPPSAPLPARPSLTVSGSDVDEADDAAEDAEDDEEEAEDREEAAGDEEEAEDGEITESKATSKSNSDASSVDRSHGSGVTSSKKSSGDGEAKKAAAATKKTK